MHKFEIVISGYVEAPVRIYVNPTPKIILDILNQPKEEDSNNSVEGFVVDGDVYLWDGEVCNLDEFAGEWEQGGKCCEHNAFWMEKENNSEIGVTLPRCFREHKVFKELAKVTSLCFI